jgi:hypothetical protein
MHQCPLNLLHSWRPKDHRDFLKTFEDFGPPAWADEGDKRGPPDWSGFLEHSEQLGKASDGQLGKTGDELTAYYRWVNQCVFCSEV